MTNMTGTTDATDAAGSASAAKAADAADAADAASATTRPFYLTTPIYYVNGEPHLGTAYTTVAADALTRAMRMDGRDAWLLTGLDEHGQKVAQAAQNAGVSPQEWVDGIAPVFKDAWKMLDIAYDDFIRTTEPRHVQGVQRFFERMHKNGYLYEGLYKGWYCLPDETFYTDEQLDKDSLGEAAQAKGPGAEAPRCPECGRALEYVTEKNLFFRLSAFQERLLAFYEANPGFISPETRRNEVVSFVRGGIRDLSVSRTTFDWGVPIPFAPGHVSYVWFDALINYITAVGYGSDAAADAAEFERRWPAQMHFVGKDIIRFHCVIWPAMLMAAGLEPPQKVFAHGFLMTKGEKMGKSRGNALSPGALVKIFGVDAYRYYFLSDVQFGADGSISLERMLQVYNADLANSWGNLCSRVLNMASRYLGRIVKPDDEAMGRLREEMGDPLADKAEGLYGRYIEAMDAVDYSGALASVQELVARANLYLEESAPWSIAKIAEAQDDDWQRQRLAFVLYNALEAMRICALLFAPVMPRSSSEVWRRLGAGELLDVRDLEAKSRWGGLGDGGAIEIGEPLFPRLSEDSIEA